MTYYIHKDFKNNKYDERTEENFTLELSDVNLTGKEKFIHIIFNGCKFDYFDLVVKETDILSNINLMISFNDCEIFDFKTDNLYLDKLEIFIKDSDIKDLTLFNFYKLKISNLKFQCLNSQMVDKLEIYDIKKGFNTVIVSENKTVDIQNSTLNELSISNIISDNKGFLKINKSEINRLTLEGQYENIVSVENSKIDQIVLEYCSFSKNALFYNIQPINPNSTNSYVRLVYSNLNNVIFDNFFFNDFNKILFFRNSFENVKFIGCGFPETLKEFDKFLTVEDINNPDKKDVNYSKVRYETFLQLKNALEKSGNYYESNKLKAVSDEALKNIDSLPVWDKIILCLNNYTNLHGQSFGRTLSVFIFTTIGLYMLYLCSLNVLLEFDSYYLNHYFTFIDITHKYNFLQSSEKNINISFLSLLIDYVSKIWIAYLIYQFIAAFRKYAKK